jgi:hypothetical protein
VLLRLLFITVASGNKRPCYENHVKHKNMFGGKMQGSFLGKVGDTVGRAVA